MHLPAASTAASLTNTPPASEDHSILLGRAGLGSDAGSDDFPRQRPQEGDYGVGLEQSGPLGLRDAEGPQGRRFGAGFDPDAGPMAQREPGRPLVLSWV